MRLSICVLLSAALSCQAFLVVPPSQASSVRLQSSFQEQFQKAQEARRARAAETGGQPVASAPSTPVPPPVQPRSVEEAVPMKPRAVAPPGVKLDPKKLEAWMDEEGEEEGVMDIGVAASEAEMLTWIPGMKDMTKEEYMKALNDKVVQSLRESRERGAAGNRATDNYLNALARPKMPRREDDDRRPRK